VSEKQLAKLHKREDIFWDGSFLVVDNNAKEIAARL
jgi:hypothetical protein